MSPEQEKSRKMGADRRTGDVGHWLRNDRLLHGAQRKTRRAGENPAPTDSRGSLCGERPHPTPMEQSGGDVNQ